MKIILYQNNIIDGKGLMAHMEIDLPMNAFVGLVIEIAGEPSVVRAISYDVGSKSINCHCHSKTQKLGLVIVGEKLMKAGWTIPRALREKIKPNPKSGAKKNGSN